MKYLGLFPDVPDLKGCSDGGCVFRPPTGMHTNGGCACMKRGADPLHLQLNLQRISRHMESMRAERDALGWARVELANIVHAERFNKSHFPDDTEFADWAQSRARHQLAAIDAALAEEARTRSEA